MGGGSKPMAQQPLGPAGPGSDDWPDDLWPDDDSNGVAGHPAAPSMPPGPPPGQPGGGPAGRRFSPTTLAVVIVVAIVAGAGIALGLQVFGSPAASTPPSQPSALGPVQPGGQAGPGGQVGPGGAVPGGGVPGGGAGTGQAFVIGKVLKVSATSITIGGPGRSITASITSSTRIAGKASAISGVKAGDQVSAQITESSGNATVAAIQDPAQMPGGGVPGG